MNIGKYQKNCGAIEKMGKWPCTVCGKGIGNNSVPCTGCTVVDGSTSGAQI